MFNPPIGEGATLFIWIAVGIIAFAAALMHVDVFKELGKKQEDKKH